MKLGMVLISNAYNPERAAIVTRSFNSLSLTNVEGMERPRMLLMAPSRIRGGVDYGHYIETWAEKWDVDFCADAASGLNSLVSVCGDTLASTDATHIVFMYDDFIYNPLWMQELTLLVYRHPDAKAWSVYRSSYTRHHRILDTDQHGDVKMTMHDGLGCMTVEEWKEYAASKRTDFTCPESMGGGCTIDIHHAYDRPGDRWATGRDYWQNIGVHPALGRRDMAIDFVGEV